MSIYRPVWDSKESRRSTYWHYDFVVRGVRYRASTRLRNKVQARAVSNSHGAAAKAYSAAAAAARPPSLRIDAPGRPQLHELGAA